MKSKILKTVKTPEQIEQEKSDKANKKLVNKIAANVAANCRKADVGLTAMELQYEFLKTSATTPLPNPELSKADNLKGWRLGMLNYREKTGLPFVNLYK